MTTDRPLVQVPGPPKGVSRPGERLVRLRRRRRLVREEFLAVAVLLLLLGVTVAVLATQWLASSPSATGQSAAGQSVAVPSGAAAGAPATVHVYTLYMGGTS